MHDALPEVVLHNGYTLSEETRRRLLWGGKEQGLDWLTRAPEIVRTWCDEWQIELHPEVPTLTYNLVLFGKSASHGEVVLKLAPPHEEVLAEVDATRAATGPGLVRLIASDPDISIMLMERVQPGTTLSTFTESGTIDDESATLIAASEMQKMWVAPPEPHRLFPLDRWFAALFRYYDAHKDVTGPLPDHLVEVAVNEAHALLATERERVVLHGDVHHDNILRDDVYGWTLIDYKGLVGERGYDIGTWMRNPPGLETWGRLEETLDRRLDIFTDELGIDRRRLWQWTMVHAVLSECWSLEEGRDDLIPDLVVVETIARLRR